MPGTAKIIPNSRKKATCVGGPTFPGAAAAAVLGSKARGESFHKLFFAAAARGCQFIAFCAEIVGTLELKWLALFSLEVIRGY